MKRAEYTYVLRTCDGNLRGYGGFQWPASGIIRAPDWDPKPECGCGLHGLAKGEGSASYLIGSKWLVVKVRSDRIVSIGGDKVKFPRGRVVLMGTREEAIAFIQRKHPDAATVYATKMGGYGATLTGGDGATLTGGNYATLTGGNYAMLTGGNYATLTGGDGATLTGGYGATLTGGYKATLTGGNYATLTGGAWATLTGGDGATLTGGAWATLIFSEFDGKRIRIKVAYVGEDGIKANCKYRLQERELIIIDD